MALDEKEIESIFEGVAEAVAIAHEAMANMAEHQIVNQICMQVLFGILLKYLGQTQGWGVQDFVAFIEEAVEGVENANFVGMTEESANEHRAKAIEQLRQMMSFSQ